MITSPEEDVLLKPVLIEDYNKFPLFIIFPNPTTGSFTLQLKESMQSAMITVEIYNMIGERVKQVQYAGSQRYELDLSGNPTGVYLVRVISGDSIGVERLIKQ